jgi:hypothetical protein
VALPASSGGVGHGTVDDVKPHDPVLLFCVPLAAATPLGRVSAGWANFVRLNHDRQNGYLVAWRLCRVPLCAESQIVQYW